MTGSRFVPLAVAVLCIAAIGVSATTLESSVATDPKDEIDPDYEALPVSQETIIEIFQEFDYDIEPPEDAEVEEEPQKENLDEPEQTPSGSSEMDAGSKSDRDGGSGIGMGEGADTEADEASLLDRLLALLTSFLRVLLPILAVLAVATLVVRYRDRLLASYASWGSDGEEGRDRSPAAGWPEADPANVVDRAWLTMVRQIDPERPAVMTPTECAAAAREAGVDPEAVEAITGAFERVHYGGAPVAAEQRRAENGLRRLRNGAGDPTDGRGRHGGTDE